MLDHPYVFKGDDELSAKVARDSAFALYNGSITSTLRAWHGMIHDYWYWMRLFSPHLAWAMPNIPLDSETTQRTAEHS